MATFQGLLFLILGVGLVAVSYRGLHHGSLPMGPSGFSGTRQIDRADQPLLYWLLFVTYSVAGLALAVFALRLLVGAAAPLPLR